jgi:hypothetical protein
MKTKRTFYSILFFCFLALPQLGLAQNSLSKTDDIGRISLTPIVDREANNFSEEVIQLLKTKLSQIVTLNGLGANEYNPRFIITAKVNVLNKEILPGPPIMVVQNLELTFFIADYVEQKTFSTTSISLKGVGNNETKSLIDAIKNIKPQAPNIQQFVDLGKTKIIEYYNNHCDMILMRVQSFASQKKFEEAIYTLVSVPEICKECYGKSMDAVGPLYQQYIDYNCNQNLSKAKAAWATGMDYGSAKEAAQYLNEIPSDSKCNAEAIVLQNEIKKHFKDLSELEVRKYEDKLALEKERIKNSKEIALEYAKNQPQTVYKLGFLF